MSKGFEALGTMLGVGGVPPGTWFFADSKWLEPMLPEKRDGVRRPVVSVARDGIEAVIVITRSSSRKEGLVHEAHSGHACDVKVAHSLLGRSHDCHINEPGHVDPHLAITLSRAELSTVRMCFEDEESPLIAWIDGRRSE